MDEVKPSFRDRMVRKVMKGVFYARYWIIIGWIILALGCVYPSTQVIHILKSNTNMQENQTKILN